MIANTKKRNQFEVIAELPILVIPATILSGKAELNVHKTKFNVHNLVLTA
ncbi:MAG: hypothetical protein ACYDH8_14135 [Syntrophales bacterium]